MPRDVLTVQTMPGALGTAITDIGAAFTFVPANGAEFVAQGGEVVIVHNVTASPAVTTIPTVADHQGRPPSPGSVGGVIAAGNFAVFGSIPLEGFQQTDGKVYVNCDQAVEIIVLRR